MDAYILAAGKGSRLGEITNETPKPLLIIREVPLIEDLIKTIREIGINKIYINIHHLAEEFYKFFENNFYSDIEIIYEEKPLGTAGSIRKILTRKQIDNLLIMHGDNYFTDNLKNMLTNFNNLKNSMCGVVGFFEVNNPKDYGVFSFDENYTVINFEEKVENPSSIFANSAIYILNTNGLQYFNELPENFSDISIDVVPNLIGKLKGIRLTGDFVDIGTPDGLKLARSLAFSRKIKPL